MIMNQTKENQNSTKDKIELQHIHVYQSFTSPSPGTRS